MPISGSNLDLTSNAGEGANNWKYEAAEAGANNDTTKADFGTSTTKRYILLKPGATNATSATPSAGQNFGWNILHTDMDWAANLPASRVIPAGAWTFTVEIAQSAASPPTTVNFKYYVHRRDTGGTLTELFNFVGANQTSVGLGVFSFYTDTSASQPEYVFANGETLHIEYWFNGGAGALGTANVVTFRVNDGANNKVTLPGTIKKRFPRAHESSLTPSATLAKTIGLPRSATLTPTASLGPRAITKNAMLATLTPTATAAKQLFKTFMGTLTPTAKARVDIDVTDLPTGGGGTTVYGMSRSRVVNK